MMSHLLLKMVRIRSTWREKSDEEVRGGKGVRGIKCNMESFAPSDPSDTFDSSGPSHPSHPRLPPLLRSSIIIPWYERTLCP